MCLKHFQVIETIIFPQRTETCRKLRFRAFSFPPFILFPKTLIYHLFSPSNPSIPFIHVKHCVFRPFISSLLNNFFSLKTSREAPGEFILENITQNVAFLGGLNLLCCNLLFFLSASILFPFFFSTFLLAGHPPVWAIG